MGADGPGIQEIAARLAAGDRDAVAWVYDSTSSDLYRRLRRRYEYPGGPDAADVLQETFLLCLRDEARLLRGFAAGLPAGTPALPSLRGYLWDLACGVATNVRRSVWSRRAQPMPEAPLAAAEPPAERSTVARDALERLDGCLRRQGERLYLYFKLRYVDGLAPEEIAAGTGWSKKATYKLRQALNEAVQRCLEQTGLRAEQLAVALLVAVLLAASACRQPPPELKAPVVVRGHREVAAGPAGRLRPRFLGPKSRPGLCFAPPAAADTSRWQAVLTFDGEESPGGLAAPAARAGPTLCFDGAIPPRLRASPGVALCGRLVDRFDGTERRLPCREVAYQPEDAAPLARLEDRFQALIAARPSLTLDELRRRLDALAQEAGGTFPLSAVRFQLVATHYLIQEGTPAALAAARQRLDRLPAWLADDAALARSLQAAQQRARLALAAGARGAAWLELQKAEERATRIADPSLLTIVMQEADLLSQAGAPDEALQRARTVLQQCGSLGCAAAELAYGRFQLAWLTLLHTDATPEQLAQAKAELRAALPAVSPQRDPREAANQRINLAYLELRTGGDPGPLLQEARRLAAAPGTGSAGRRTLTGWISLIAGLAALERGDATAALAACGAISGEDSELAAARLSCRGRAHRLAGDLPAAAQDLDGALRQHERMAAALGQRLPLGPGERAEDFARAARVAVERGDPAGAWSLLLRLDSLSAQERERARCRALARGEDALRWAAIDRESAAILHDLSSLPALASGGRERRTAEVRAALEERLRGLSREWPGCPAPGEADDAGVSFRAFTVEDEALLLHRDERDQVRLERRTRWPRRARLAALHALAAGIEAGRGDAAQWRALAAPAAAALLPLHPETLGPVTELALHGALQLVPPAALPLPPGCARGWLGEATAVALHVAGARAAAGGPAGSPLFVVDPAGDLAGAERSLPAYRRLFPAARILRGGEATREAVGRALAGAEWLHIDAHASYDPVFPEMSRLQLAGGDLSLLEWSRLPAPRRFANLSGCRTASWPATADSGQYGLGGLLARLGAGWVVATRGPVPDGAADLYNQAFYRALAAGSTVPAAHASGQAALRPSYPPQVWGAILLLHAAERGKAPG